MEARTIRLGHRGASVYAKARPLYWCQPGVRLRVQLSGKDPTRADESRRTVHAHKPGWGRNDKGIVKPDNDLNDPLAKIWCRSRDLNPDTPEGARP